MKMRLCSICAALALATMSATAAADNDHGIYASVGTLGMNLGYKYGLNENVGFRVGVNSFQYSETIQDGDVDYKGDLELRSVELLADWHPFGNGFALTGGVLLNNNKFTGTARPNGGTLDIGDGNYAAGPNASAKATVELGDGVTPYVGFGYTVNPVSAKGLRFNFGLGVVFQDPKAKVEVSGISGPNLEADRAQAERELQDELDALKNYPVLTLGLSYAF